MSTVVNTSATSSDYMIKPIASAGFAVAIDQLVLNEPDLNKSLIFGASSAIGVYGGMMIGSYIPDFSESVPAILGNGKGLVQRISEVGFGSGAGYAINKYVLKNSSYRENMTNKLIALVAADIGGEYIADFLAGRPLSITS